MFGRDGVGGYLGEVAGEEGVGLFPSCSLARFMRFVDVLSAEASPDLTPTPTPTPPHPHHEGMRSFLHTAMRLLFSFSFFLSF